MAQANQAGGTLKSQFGDAVMERGPFSWMMPDPFFRGAEISEIDGVVLPGEAFMETVFSLPVGKAGAAFNEPESYVYGIRLVSLEPTAEDLRRAFVTARFPTFLVVAMHDQREIYTDWMRTVEQQSGLDWVEKPETLNR